MNPTNNPPVNNLPVEPAVTPEVNINTPKRFSRKIYVLLALLIVLIIAAGLGLWWHRYQNTQHNYSTPVTGSSALLVATKYLQAREDAVGADQATPVSWISTVKPITTGVWYKSLQTNANTLASSTLPDYDTAHADNYVVKVSINSCVIDNSIAKPTKDDEYLFCALKDTTINKATGAVIPNSALSPSDWTKFGYQSPPTLQMVKQNGQWLVASDNTGQGD